MIYKSSRPQGSKARIRAITKNFFLHFHSPKIHTYSLNPGFTLGLGVINLTLFFVLLFSGILLMIYYKPSVEQAYFSILDINNVVLGGRYLRNIHRWAAHGLVFVAMLHMSRTFYMASYSGQQRATWNLGVGLLLTTVITSFSGYLLPWDQLGFWAVTIASNILGSTREVTDALGITAFIDPGLLLKKVFLGAADVEQQALTRFYMLHIVLLPLLFFLLMGLHFWRIRKNKGLNLPQDAHDRIRCTLSIDQKDADLKTKDPLLLSWPVMLWAELAIIMTTLAILSIFALAIDAPLQEMANAAMPENPAKSPWYFLGVQELVSYSAFGGGILVPVAVIIILFAIPYIDTDDVNTGIWFSGKAGLRLTIISGLVALGINIALLVVLIEFGWLRDWIPAIPYWSLIILNPGVMLGFLFTLLAYLIYKRTKSARLAVISLYSSLLVSYTFLTIIGICFRGPDWKFVFF